MFIKKGDNTTVYGEVKPRVKCKSCNRQQFEADTIKLDPPSQKFTPDVVKRGKRFVITSVQNNTDTNHEFLKALESYCTRNFAELLIIPLTYEGNEYDDLDWDCDSKYLVNDTFSLNGMITVLGDMNIVATAQNPISTLETLSKGTSLIVPHNQLQLKSLPVTGKAQSVVLCSTGTISTKNYPQNKTGRKALFNHSNSAILIDFESDMYHMRVLNADSQNGFFDIDGYYIGDEFAPLTHVSALITGDEHVLVSCLLYTSPSFDNW